MLRKTRIIVACLTFGLLSLLFLDFTGTLHPYFGWLAKIQLVPAILSINVALIVGLALLALLFGRVYCSMICPLGIFQDCVSNVARRRKGKSNRFNFSLPKTYVRYALLGLFVVAIIFGISAVVSILDPYAAYGRIASNFVAPFYRWGNNLLALLAESVNSYAFYSTDVWLKGWPTFGLAAITLIAVGVLAWRNGRTYCNVICPVGSALGLISKVAIFRLALDSDKCTKCKVCESGCKASCIDAESMAIDNSRCVNCFNCIENCKQGAIKYASAKPDWGKKTPVEANQANQTNQNGVTRRDLISVFGAMAIAETIQAPLLYVDGGLAKIEDKKIPTRKTPVVPPGAQGAENMKSHCTACQLCVSACPNGVLRPSSAMATFMQPQMSFEKGYCRPECTECSLVCPTSAIKPITVADKTAVSIGMAVWITENCVVNRDGVQCNNCEFHCPTDAIQLIAIDPNDSKSLKTPAIDKELCIGCGACEYVCPARPFSAIYVEGNIRHHTVLKEFA
ncbi:MAG: 4Fe-4S dicluster domain-containing protein [Holophagales bacterium]|jgi:polyferredoxin|nr:4Fe-4S dicluster domain-containing protein [Holophagales bacterium]